MSDTEKLNQPVKVLLVEDNNDIREALTEVLNVSGVTTKSFGHAEELITALETGGADFSTSQLLIADIVLPGIDGPELYREVAKHISGIRVLFISGYSSSDIRDNYDLPEESETLSKPFRPSQVLAKIKEMLGAP